MNADDFQRRGEEFSQRLFEFLKQAQTPRRADEDADPSAVAKPLLFLIDSATKHLNELREMVAGAPPRNGGPDAKENPLH
ncbi:MAG TPA: hypothetical protein VNH44_19620, partial [Micropepsaceae bacterium]|nr:hypothetical protein [Micropepsaceae bacterium]